MRRTNVLYVIEELELGGAERVVIDQATGLDRERYLPVVCCLRAKGEFAPEVEARGIAVIELGKRLGVDLGIIGKLRRVIREQRADIVHTHLWVASLWGRLAAISSGVPVVSTYHSVDVWKGPAHRVLDRMLAPLTARLFAVSEQVKRFYVEDVGISAKRLQVIHNGIRSDTGILDEGQNRELREELGIELDVPVIANIGRLVDAKAHPVFFEALRRLHSQGERFVALTVGDGPLREALLREGRDLIEAGKLRFTGLRKDVGRILDIADLSVLSSVREGFSMVILESMAKGVPVVATRVGGNPEQIVHGQTGLLVDPGDPAGLAAAMRTILCDSELSQEMSMNSRRRLEEEFSLVKMVQQTQDAYEDVLR